MARDHTGCHDDGEQSQLSFEPCVHGDLPAFADYFVFGTNLSPLPRLRAINPGSKRQRLLS